MNTEEYLNQLVSELFEQAMTDDIISDEEFTLMRGIEIEFTRFLKNLEDALEDGIITEEEQQFLDKLREEVLKNAKKIAAEDGIVDKDEQAMLDIMEKVISHYAEFALHSVVTNLMKDEKYTN